MLSKKGDRPVGLLVNDDSAGENEIDLRVILEFSVEQFSFFNCD